MEYQKRYANSHAIVVGIDTYAHPRLVPLGKAEQDAFLMTELRYSQPAKAPQRVARQTQQRQAW